MNNHTIFKTAVVLCSISLIAALVSGFNLRELGAVFIVMCLILVVLRNRMEKTEGK